MKKSPSHLKTDEPKLSFEDWYLDLVRKVAKKLNIERLAVHRYMDVNIAFRWWEDGFDTEFTLNENFK